ncbi:helix-turn-helix domain-containing protein [Streptomyces hoynatensis]|uniref:XRE family transcriptional regulator n=1 Tax=Streptomyces hoynatensis TaxID=1141874 RepID=A0A3A9ZEW4_9ACTN|nr:helix-turn-helix transcriptional regulator [Streptomyces hoynatensis]RKN46843.1 XRE family transcriptional regulator [Streptomyces hoynatensis]
MSYPANEHTGVRIADYRKLRRWTQEGLAQRAAVSLGMIKKVEAGLVPASPALVAATARALHVDVSVLYGQPYVSQLRQDEIDSLITPLTEALDLYDVDPDPDIRPRPVHELHIASGELVRLFRATDYRRVGERLPGLLGELTTVLSEQQPADDRRRAAAALATTYWIAHQFAGRLGYPELASIALDRMGWVAARAEDPLLQAVRLYSRSLTYVRRGRPEVGLKVVARAQRLVEQAEEPRGVSALAVSGKLHLRASFIAARAKDETQSADFLALGSEAAERIGRDVPDVYWLSFGPTDVAQYTVETRVDLEQLPEAVQHARNVRFPAGYSPTRVGRHFIDLSRAFTEMGKTDQAVRSLRRAREAAAQQVRYHPTAREVVGTLVRRQRRLNEELMSLAVWVGMA